MNIYRIFNGETKLPFDDDDDDDDDDDVCFVLDQHA
jgi:hypothetical protein